MIMITKLQQSVSWGTTVINVAASHRYIFHISSFWKTKTAIFILCALLCAILKRFIFHILNSYRTNIRVDYFHFVCICEQYCCSYSDAIWASWRPKSVGIHELFRVTTILSSDIFIHPILFQLPFTPSLVFNSGTAFVNMWKTFVFIG